MNDMITVFPEVARRHCYACEINEPSQRYHQCLKSKEMIVKNNFETLLEQVDFSTINERSLMTRKHTSESDQLYITKDELLRDQEWMKYTKEILVQKV